MSLTQGPTLTTPITSPPRVWRIESPACVLVMHHRAGLPFECVTYTARNPEFAERRNTAGPRDFRRNRAGPHPPSSTNLRRAVKEMPPVSRIR